MKEVELIPYTSAGMIQIGATVGEVENILGKPESIELTKKGDKDYRYSWGIVKFSTPKFEVAEITFFSSVKVLVKGVDIFNDEDVLAKLSKFETHAFEFVGFLFLIDLGIALSGIHTENDERVVTMFKKGSEARFKDKLVPYQLN